MWTEKIAKAEVGNVPYGAIFLASLAQAGCVLGYAALQKKWPENATLAKWAPSIVGGAGAVLVPQTGKVIGEATAKSLAIGCGNVLVAPWLGRLFNMILYPAVPARRPVGKKSNPGNPNPGPKVDLNSEVGARQLGATL